MRIKDQNVYIKCIDCIIMVCVGNFIELLDVGVSWSVESVLVAFIVQ